MTNHPVWLLPWREAVVIPPILPASLTVSSCLSLFFCTANTLQLAERYSVVDSWQPEAIDKSCLEHAEKVRWTPLVPFLDWIMGETGTKVNPTALRSQS